jgi:3-deoxy-manno-octulosonate cytidylyltransferase (CMP-KDO synthetase)
MTSPTHASGTDRLAEVARRRGWSDDAVVVNLQGDEPRMPGEAIRRCVAALASAPDAGIATLAAPITSPEELFDPNAVKVVLDQAGRARTFSRAPIPWVRASFRPGEVPRALPGGVRFLRHLGLYAYRVAELLRVSAAPPDPYEVAESLEQLRAVAMGIPIAVAVLDRAPGPGVDTEADLARVEAELAQGRDPGSTNDPRME